MLTIIFLRTRAVYTEKTKYVTIFVDLFALLMTGFSFHKRFFIDSCLVTLNREMLLVHHIASKRKVSQNQWL